MHWRRGILVGILLAMTGLGIGAMADSATPALDDAPVALMDYVDERSVWRPQELPYNKVTPEVTSLVGKESVMVSTGTAADGEARVLFVRFIVDPETNKWQPRESIDTQRKFGEPTTAVFVTETGETVLAWFGLQEGETLIAGDKTFQRASGASIVDVLPDSLATHFGGGNS